MKFAPVPVKDAEGAILAHSLTGSKGPIRKGTVLALEHLDQLKDTGISEIIVAQLEPGDVGEDEAARRIADRLSAPELLLAPAFTGRANLVAERAGVVRVDEAAVARMNDVDEGLTLATLPDLSRVDQGQLVATIKIIPYGIEDTALMAAIDALGGTPITLHPFRRKRVRLVLTRTPGFRDRLLTKGEAAVRARVEALGSELVAVDVVPHRVDDIAEVLEEDDDLVLVLGASATSDRADVVPAALVKAGGRIERFGMPVDPGNLLLLGELSGRPLVGLPGCARSPALNGVDWVLERLVAGIPVGGKDIAAMGAGGLLKEMPGRPQPRQPAKG